ncbi:hypothetical protein HPP92_021990 [Vanilla planifolia]|uniref:ethanolamine-phosphate cytidylyltransferase n=1 Tax=Vanilla planifolia TaxID=51239 RepID=A0A835UHM7_VANPL|nr:hypothetical protein HPP92_021990 [Vanilla planifolia]
MGSTGFENCWIWDSIPRLVGLGGLMITAAVVGLSKGYFWGIGVCSFPVLWPGFGIFYKKKSWKRPVRVYMDGCFDLMHYGHANALRQAKTLGDVLVVGVISDEEIIANKGPPVLSMEERLILVRGLKWVDEVITNAPYAITEEFMNTLFNKYNIDYIIHGDDPCLLADGTDAYAHAKKAGRYKQIKRTEGVSSTDIVDRILSSSKCAENDNQRSTSFNEMHRNEGNILHEASESMTSRLSHFLPTSRRIMQFSNGKGPGPDAHVVYIDGAFDLFHAGHVEFFRCARQLGDFLLVGIHSDQTISQRRGFHPIMHLHERSLSVLACRYVDEVIIGAPWEVTKDMMRTFNISLVVHGTVSESSSRDEVDPYLIPKSMGIFKAIVSPKAITSSSVASKVIDNLETYKRRNLKKKQSEGKYYEEKKFVTGD